MLAERIEGFLRALFSYLFTSGSFRYGLLLVSNLTNRICKLQLFALPKILGVFINSIIKLHLKPKTHVLPLIDYIDLISSFMRWSLKYRF